jgi:hypothetical protein
VPQIITEQRIIFVAILCVLLHIRNTDHWTRWPVTRCCFLSPDRVCAINCVCNIAVRRLHNDCSTIRNTDCVWNAMANTQKPDFVFRRNGRIHLNRRGRQFSRRRVAEVCASAVVMLDTPCSEVVWRVRATHSIRQFPLHFPFCASPCTITFQLDSTKLLSSRTANSDVSCSVWNATYSRFYVLSKEHY